MNMNIKPILVAVALACSAVAAHADEVYGGIGFPGLVLGYATPLSNGLTVRGEFAGGLSMSRNGQREGMDYSGELKSQRLGAFVDWFVFSGGFRLTGGLTANDIKAQLNGKGGTGKINGKTVDMTGETFNVTIKYPQATPYLGLGWGHQASPDKGLGFFADLGVMVGKFDASATTSLVGKQGITQADVDQEVSKVRDSLSKLAVLPAVSIGLTYRF